MRTNTNSANIAQAPQHNLNGVARKDPSSPNKRNLNLSKTQHLEEATHHDEGEGTWIFSYADLITILMMFFILMLSISNVSPEKFNALKEALKTDEKPQNKAQPSSSTQAPAAAINESQNTNARLKLADVDLEKLAAIAASTGGDRSTRILAGAKLLLEALDQKNLQAQKESLREFEKLQHDLAESAKVIQNSQILVSGDTRRLSLQFPSSAFFKTTLAKPNQSLATLGPKQVQADDTLELRPEAKELVEKIYASLKSLEPVPAIEIESHVSLYATAAFKPDGTGQKLRRSKQAAYQESNYRATKILELFETQGAQAENIALQAYGFSRPLAAENDRLSAKAQVQESINDRIVIHLVRKPRNQEAAQ